MMRSSPIVTCLFGVALIVTSACGRSADEQATTAGTSSAPGGLAGAGPTGSAAFMCGDTPVAVQVHDDAIDLVLDDATHRLARVVAASGARYEGIVDGQTYSFWERGEEATFTAGSRTYPTCRRVQPPPTSPAR